MTGTAATATAATPAMAPATTDAAAGRATIGGAVKQAGSGAPRGALDVFPARR